MLSFPRYARGEYEYPDGTNNSTCEVEPCLPVPSVEGGSLPWKRWIDYEYTNETSYPKVRGCIASLCQPFPNCPTHAH